MMGDTPLGRFCWYDLMTPDPDAAPAFYAAVTGWGTMPFEGGEKPYTMWTNDGQPIAGSVELPAEATAAGAPPHWLAYVSTPDVGATARRARDMGGSVMAEFDIPNVGSVAVIADPQGAVLAAYQPTDFAPGHDGAGQIGEFSWHELMTSDPEAARDFYFDLFGWEDTGVADLGEMGPYRMYGQEGRSMGGIMRCPPGAPTSWLYYVRVADLDAALVRLEREGGSVLAGPMEVPGGDRVAPCMDAQGAAFALHEVAGD